MYELLFPELLRGGSAFIPGLLFQYASELNLDMEDLGFFSVLFYCLSNSRPLAHQGIAIGQVQKICPGYSNARLNKRLNRLMDLGLISVSEDGSRRFVNKCVYLEPLFDQLSQFVLRDHSGLDTAIIKPQELLQQEQELRICQEEISRLKLELAQARQINGTNSSSLPSSPSKNPYFTAIADFIAERTGTLLSSRMSEELDKWLNDYGMESQLLLCLLELCFERNITSPQNITRLVKEIKEHGIASLEGLEQYFKTFVDAKQILSPVHYGYDTELIELTRFLNIDMKAEARRQIYYKWRNDWGFTHEMIMKAGEMMSSRTNQGGLEYMDRILERWKKQQISTLEDVEKEIAAYRQAQSKEPASKNKKSGNRTNSSSKHTSSSSFTDFYVPKDVLEELKKNA